MADENLLEHGADMTSKGEPLVKYSFTELCQIFVIINKLYLICFMSFISELKWIILFFTHKQVHFYTTGFAILISTSLI